MIYRRNSTCPLGMRLYQLPGARLIPASTPILQLRSEDGELDRGNTKSKNLISKVN